MSMSEARQGWGRAVARYTVMVMTMMMTMLSLSLHHRPSEGKAE